MTKTAFIYSFLIGIYGISNILAILFVFKNNSNDIALTDDLFLVLTIAAFLVSIVVGPLQAGFKQYVQRVSPTFSTLKIVEECVLSFSLIIFTLLILFAILNFGIGYEYFLTVVLFYISSNIIFELQRYNALLSNRFKDIMLAGIPNLTLPLFPFVFNDINAFLIYSALIKYISIAFLLRKNSGYSFDMFHYSLNFVLQFYKEHRRYLISNVVSAGSLFVPSLVLGNFGVGFVSAYYFSMRLCVTPISIFVVPFVDFFRFRYFFNNVDRSKFIIALLIILLGAILWVSILFFTSDLILSYFVADSDQIKIFSIFLIPMLSLVISQSLYVLLTRTAEVNLSINKIALFGMFGHIGFIIIIISASFFDGDFIYYVRPIMDLVYFLPVAFVFALKSSRNWRG